MHRHLASIAWGLQQAHRATGAHRILPCISSAHCLLYHALSSLLDNHQLPGWCIGTLDPLLPDHFAARLWPPAGFGKATDVLQQCESIRSYSCYLRATAHSESGPHHTELSQGNAHSNQQQQHPSSKKENAAAAHTDAGSSSNSSPPHRPAQGPPSEHAASKAGSKSAADSTGGNHSTSSSGSSRGSSSSGSHQKSFGNGDDGDTDVADLLVEWRLLTSEWYGGGLNYVINSHLQMPQMSTWPSLYPRASHLGFLARVFFPKGSSLLTLILKWQFKGSRQIAIPLLETAHEELNSTVCIEDFQRNLGMAIGTVLELYAQADWQALKPMVSSGLLDSMQAAYDAQSDTAQTLGIAGTKVEDVKLDIHKLDVVCAHAISRAQLAAIDEDRSKAHVQDSVSSTGNSGRSSSNETNAMWDVVHVYVESQWHATMRTSDGVEQTSQPKSGHWVFCRGPVPFDKVVSAEADLPWFILAWL